MEQDEGRTDWVREGDDLWGSGTDPWTNACLNFAADPFDPYSTGYRRAADIITEYVIQQLRDQDTLIYPIVFLYRHHIELKLKEIICFGSKLTIGKAEIAGGHNLKELWGSARPILESICSKEFVDDINNFEVGLFQLISQDGKSTSFRYPIDKKRSPSLPNVRHINIGNFRDVMTRLCNFLDGCTSHIDYLLDCKAEMEANLI